MQCRARSKSQPVWCGTSARIPAYRGHQVPILYSVSSCLGEVPGFDSVVAVSPSETDSMCVYHATVPRLNPSAKMAGRTDIRASIEAHLCPLSLRAVQGHGWVVAHVLAPQKPLAPEDQVLKAELTQQSSLLISLANGDTPLRGASLRP